MTPTPDSATLALYLDAAARLQGFELAPDVAARVLEQLERVAMVAAPMLAFELSPHDEPAPVYSLEPR
jgi:hypothetical protein